MKKNIRNNKENSKTFIFKNKTYNEMILYFLSEKFEFNKENLDLLFNTLHELEYNFIIDKKIKVVFYSEKTKTYKEMVKKGSAQFCDARRDYRKQTIKILFNTKENSILNKWRILNAFFHELEHEKQLDNICSKFKKNISDYEHFIRFSYIWGQELYHSEIIEIEAIIGEINKMVEVLNNNLELINKESIYLLICLLLELEYSLNYFESEEVCKEIISKYGKELKQKGIKLSEFKINSKKIIELHSIAYKNKLLFWRNKKLITFENSEYKEKLQKILDKKIINCYNNAFKLVKNQIKLFKPTCCDDKTLSCENYKKLTTLKDKIEIIELLYEDLADKFEQFQVTQEELKKF